MTSDAEVRCRDDVVAINDAAVVSEMQSAAHARTTPLNVTLELTLGCNIRCLHCYNFDRDVTPANTSGCRGDAPELTLPEILDLLADLRAAGCLFLTLTGGEILSYPHLFAVLDRARELNFAVQLLTNGTLLRPGMAARLAGYRNILGMSDSLYGATAEVHDGITQVRGSWRRTWAGIERLRTLGIAVRVKLIVMRQNAHEVAAWRADADGKRLPYFVDLTITSRHDGSHGSLATRVDDDQLRSLLAGPLRDLLPKQPRRHDEDSFRCNCARGNCAIAANGDVLPCVSVPWPAGNVRAQRFLEIWKYSPVFQRIRGLRMADYPSCSPCPDKGYCARERGAAYTASGSYTGVDPFVCRTAAVRREIIEGDEVTRSAGVAAAR
jgi:radical SAM protein with 4Fe4S-binding SPASM domain